MKRCFYPGNYNVLSIDEVWGMEQGSFEVNGNAPASIGDLSDNDIVNFLTPAAEW